MDGAPRYVHLAPGAMPPEFASEPSRVLVVLDQLVAPDWQQRVSRWLIATGCLYMLAWGPGCSSWDDSVDHANSEAFEHGDIPGESDAMTTWHDNEPLEECMWFAKNCAFHPDVSLDRTVILHIGPAPREHELLQAYADA
jgi:hypothetical protein